jgi:hypothetical protein
MVSEPDSVCLKRKADDDTSGTESLNTTFEESDEEDNASEVTDTQEVVLIGGMFLSMDFFSPATQGVVIPFNPFVQGEANALIVESRRRLSEACDRFRNRRPRALICMEFALVKVLDIFYYLLPQEGRAQDNIYLGGVEHRVEDFVPVFQYADHVLIPLLHGEFSKSVIPHLQCFLGLVNEFNM